VRKKTVLFPGKNRKYFQNRIIPALGCLFCVLLLSACSGSPDFLSGKYRPIGESTAEKTGEPSVSSTESTVKSTQKNAGGSSAAVSKENQTAGTKPAETTAPKPAETAAVKIPANEPVHLCFAGDILLSDHVLNAYDKGGISGILDDTLLKTAREADIFMANEEFPFGTKGTAADKQYTFRVDPKRAAIFRELGIDIVSLANNHSLDFGRDALQETFDTLDANGILYAGAGKNLSRAEELQVIEVKGKKIGFLAASRVIPEGGWGAGSSTSGLFTTYDPKELVKQIKESKTKCDFTVVYVHWGVERKTEPESYQVSLSRQYVDAGANLVIGSHPHVLQPIVFYKNVPVAYSLGNFLFGSSIPSTELLCADIMPDNSVSVSIIPGKGSAGKTVHTGEKETVRQ